MMIFEVIFSDVSVTDAKCQPHGRVTAFYGPWPLTFVTEIGGRNEIVFLPRVKFKSSRGRRKGTEGEGEKFRLIWGVANCNNFGRMFGKVRHPALIVVELGHVVNDPLLGQCSGHTWVVIGANNIGLLVIQLSAVLYVNGMTIEKQRVGRIPMD